MTSTAQRRQGWRWGYLAPAAVIYALFVLYPLGQTIWYSFFEWNGITAATWVGFGNYVEAVTSPRILGSLSHSLVFVVFYALLPIAIGLFLAGIFTRIRVRGMTFFRAVLFVPQVLSTVIVAVSWRWLYAEDGPINAVLRAVGLDSITRAWLGEFDTALPSIGLIGTWVEYGLCMVLFIAGTQKIPAEQFEAARLDGAGAVREFFAVTLPNLRGEIAVAMVLTMTFALRNFDIVWNTTTGGPGNSTSVPSMYIYEGAFITRHVGDAAAIGVLLSLLVLTVTSVILGVVRRKEDA
jgi:raffinose/stachyose/melibiose transport system permease protein